MIQHMKEIETGYLAVYLSDEPVTIADEESAVIIDASNARTCGEVEEIVNEAGTVFGSGPDRRIVISNLLDGLYDSSVPTREAAKILGRVKSRLETLVELGAEIAVYCRRRTDAGTRSHFCASLCASADRIHILNRS
jgi:hypothetical protein